MRLTRKRVSLAVAAAGVAAAATLTAGCSNQLNDLGGVPQEHPDYSVTYLNAKNFPNITLVCIDGPGFATTTRDYDSATAVPQWDALCKSKEKAGSGR